MSRLLFAILLLASCRAYAADSAGAVISKPFMEKIVGAECFTSKAPKYAGLVAFGFPNRAVRKLAFTLGPLTDGYSPGQEKNKPYKGPGKYTHIGVSWRSEDGRPGSLGYGTVTVNSDERSGTVEIAAWDRTGKNLFGRGFSATWDCGSKIGG